MLVCGVLVGATAKPSLYHGYVPATYSTYYPYSLSSQYHAQDELGQYSYGYSGDTSAKHETKTLDGVTRGGYSYIDANGIVQTVNYVSDSVYGFRVAATNLPRDPAPVVAAAPIVVPQTVVVDTPAVAAAKASHLATVQAAAAQAAAAQAAAVAQVAAVQTVTAAPVVVSQPVVIDTAAVAAAKAAHLATVQAANARAAAAQIAAAHAVAPLPVTETPEVQRAKAEHLVAFQKAAAEAAAAPDYSEVVATAPLAPIVSAAPLTSTYYSAPLVYGYDAGYPLAAARYSYVPVAHTSYSALTPLSSQYHAQDELGQYSYGYAGGPSAKHETRTLDGVTRGSYSYIDANGIVQTVNYVADDVFGFRVAATNLPVAPGAH
ncbi:hypothetical protein PR048_030233 [Dryococelus australis]|uniref:Cuticle protein 6 n=1 Tax=Dryococelus australis TaxID=614101 RepID=A0ABQ9GCB1_9NEOP|nr:hypothetical protein PR048_030233 [Dryococelus australis]